MRSRPRWLPPPPAIPTRLASNRSAIRPRTTRSGVEAAIVSSLVCTSASALVLKRDSSEAASRLRSRQLAGRSLHPASRQAGRPGTLPRAPSRSAPRGPHLRARPFAPAHDAAPMRSLCGCGDYRRPAAEPRMGIPPAPPSAAIAAPKCDPQAGRHLQGDTRPRPLRLPLCYVFAVT